MFKITANGKTFVCNNEDAWSLEASLWFEKGENGKYGAMFVGFSDLFPQGGMNEHGLSFDGFTVSTRDPKVSPAKKLPANPWGIEKQILQTCKTVKEVQACYEKIDHSYLNGGMLLFVDKTGDYLVVECDTVLYGNNSTYILSNFCPSQTKNLKEVKIKRYIKGTRFLYSTFPQANINYCRAMMDTMHVCRAGLGDGTMYTNIFDTGQGNMHLYFYHDFKHAIVFNLREELKKGNHVISIPDVFPINPEYERLKKYHTPVSSKAVFWTLIGSTILLFFLTLNSLAILIMRLIKKHSRSFNMLRLSLLVVNCLLIICIGFILKDKGIAYLGFYPEAPWLSLYKIASFTPWILVATMIAIFLLAKKVYTKSFWSKFSKFTFALNTITFFVCFLLFSYWGLYKIL